jgi:hypothetical protein
MLVVSRLLTRNVDSFGYKPYSTTISLKTTVNKCQPFIPLITWYHNALDSGYIIIGLEELTKTADIC